MHKNIQTKFKLKTLIVVFLTPILLLGFFIAPMRADWADHLVISAVQITEGEGKTGHDFIEIYNPTEQDINLKGYRLVKRTKTGATDTSIKSWTGDVVVKAHSWRLWASSDDKAYPLSFGADDATTATLAADNGIAIRFGAADTGEIIDSIAWGAAENIFKESAAVSNPGVGEKLVRKPAGGETGNGVDTDNNADDFIVAINFIPRNSQSSSMPPITNVNPGPNATPDSTFIADPVPASTPHASVPEILPVARAGQDKEAIVGENIDFDGSDSFDPSGKELSYSWSFGDGENASGENVMHSYKLAGEYVVVLKVNNVKEESEDSLKVKISEPEFSDKIILSEILPNPAGADKDGEWIELANIGDKKINLRGWILDDAVGSGSKPYVFKENIYIEPAEFLLIGRAESKLVLPNKGGEINLLRYDGKILSKVSYGAAKDGESYALIGAVWQWTKSLTPGGKNILSQPVPKKTSKTPAVKTVEAKKETNIAANNAVNKNQEEIIQSNEYESEIDLEDLEETDAADENLIAGFTENADENSEGGSKEINGKNLAAGEIGSVGKAGLIGQNILNNSGNEAKNNPWFWGNMATSILSLYLVWRYQGLKKTI